MEKLELVPVRTRILTPADNIVDAIEEYGKDLIGPDDVVSVAESVVAITQGRMVRPEEMNPCFLARVLCRFIPQKASLSSIYGMQLAMDAAGKWRIAFWLFVGMLAKLVGKSGVFYAMSGEQTRLIDDVTGTMPPFDKHIVLGPEDPDGVGLNAGLHRCELEGLQGERGGIILVPQLLGFVFEGLVQVGDVLLDGLQFSLCGGGLLAFAHHS